MTKLFKLSFLICLIQLTYQCPVWRCARKEDLEIPGYCYYLDQNSIVAGPWCVQNSKGCSIISYFNEETNLKCPALPGANVYEGKDDIDTVLGKKSQWNDVLAAAKASDANAAAAAESEFGSNSGGRILSQDRQLTNVKAHVLTEQLKKELCVGKDLWHLYQCDNFCVQKAKCNNRKLEEEDSRQLSSETQKVCHECDWQAFKEAKLHKKEGKQNWNKCDYDNECSSGDCDCVISTDNRGRCTTSVYEEVYENFWKYLCEKTNELEYEEKVCEKFIQVELGHYIQAVAESESELKCLAKFSEVSDLTNLVARVVSKSGGHSFGIFFILLILIGGAAAFFYFYKKNKKEDRPASDSQSQSHLKQNQPYGQMN